MRRHECTWNCLGTDVFRAVDLTVVGHFSGHRNSYPKLCLGRTDPIRRHTPLGSYCPILVFEFGEALQEVLDSASPPEDETSIGRGLSLVDFENSSSKLVCHHGRALIRPETCEISLKNSLQLIAIPMLFQSILEFTRCFKFKT